MTTWRSVKLGEAADEITVGHVGSMASEYRESGVPFLRSQNVRPHRIDLSDVKYIDERFHSTLKKSTLRPGDVVTVRTGAPGQSAVVPEWLPIANCSDLVIFRTGPSLDPHWLSYYLNWVTDTAISGLLVGAVQQHFNVKSAKGLDVSLPPIGEQQAIAEVLGALDDKIAANRTVARIASELISARYAHALSMGEVRRQRLFDVFEVDFGAAFKGVHFSAVGVGRPLLRIRDLKTGRPQVWTVEQRPDECVISPGDVIVGMDAEFRPSWWKGEPAVLNQRVCRVRGKAVGSAFVVESLKKPLAASENEKTATTVIHLNKSDLERVQILVPPQEVLDNFENETEPLASLHVQMARESDVLAKTRDELLPLLMSGKLRVKDAEKKVEAIV